MQRQWSQWLVIGLGIVVHVLPPGLFAQEGPPVSAATALTEAPHSPPERLIYLPYKNLRSVFEKEAAAVFIPLQEYLRLWQQSLGAMMRPPDQAPLSGLITAADYLAKVEQDVARIRATLTVQVLNPGWAEIPIKFGNAAVGDVSSDPPGVLLRGTGPGTYTLLLNHRGESKISLELAARVLTSPEGRSLELQIPPVAVTNFEIAVPDADQTIEIQPKLLLHPVDAAEKTSRLRASLGSVETVSARWHPRVSARPDMELLASATSATLIQVEDGVMHADAFFRVEVLRGNLEQLRIAVPKGHRILDVASESRIREWKVAEEEQRQVVTVELLSRSAGAVPLEIHTERPLDDEPIDVAGLDGQSALGIHLLDVLRESGQVAVRSSADLVVSATTQQGLVRIDETEADARIRKPGAAFYKFYSPACRLAVTAKPVAPRLLVDHLTEITLTDDQLKLDAQLQYAIERAGVFELTFKLPDGLTVENVVCEGLKQFDLSADRKVLTVALKERRLGGLAVRITAVRPRDPQAEANGFSIPLLEPDGVELEHGKLRIKALDALDVITDTEQIAGFQPDPDPAVAVAPPFRLVSAWTFNRRPVNLPARTVSKPTRLTADVGATLEVKQGQLQAAVDLTYHVEYAGLDTFRVAVPEVLADAVQINLAEGGGPPIKQKSRAAEAVDGWVTWTVVLQRETVGDVRFRLTYDLTPQPGSTAGSEAYQVALVRVQEPFDSAEADARKRSIPLSRISGEVSVRKDRVLSVAVNASGGDVEAIDVRELTRLSKDGFVAFRYFKQPVTVEITAAKFEVQEMVETVVSRGLVEVVLNRDGGAMFRTRYVIKSSERQRLPIDLPKGARALGQFVDRKPVALETNPAGAADREFYDGFFVNVARTKSSDESFTLVLQYQLSLSPPPFVSHGGEVQLRLPVIGSATADKTAQQTRVAVQQLRVAAWVPDDYALVGTPKHFNIDCRPSLRRLLWRQPSNDCFAELQQWIGDDAGGLVDFPTEGQAFAYSNLGGSRQILLSWWHLPFYTWVVSGAVVLIALVLRNTRWENKLTMLLLAAFVASAYALQDIDVVLHGLLVAGYGIAALVVLWTLHGLLGRSRSARTRGTPPVPPATVIPPPGAFDSLTLGT